MFDSMRPHRRQPTRRPRTWILQARTLSSWVSELGYHFLLQCMKVKSEVKSLSCVQPSATLWTAAFQAPPSMGFSRQEYWSGVPLPSPLYPIHLGKYPDYILTISWLLGKSEILLLILNIYIANYYRLSENFKNFQKFYRSIYSYF